MEWSPSKQSSTAATGEILRPHKLVLLQEVRNIPQMPINIWGIDPATNEPACFYLRCPATDAPKEKLRAKILGWREIATTPSDNHKGPEEPETTQTK